MTKKQKILDLFYSTEWHNHHDGNKIKILSKEDFKSVGLYGNIENSQQHCDLIYARKIIQGLGHRVIIGGAFFVWEKQLKKRSL
jgi:hypothetical protein